MVYERKLEKIIIDPKDRDNEDYQKLKDWLTLNEWDWEAISLGNNDN